MKTFLLGFIALLASGFLLYKGYHYLGVRDVLPVGTTIAGVDVTGLTLAAARERWQPPTPDRW
jgi:hypothetical protein